mmetsp:Transcript_10920/g.24527  ORF Transcript_10920/g.24527 Transcript_10920/m.24527 type:complete len:478 (-) Transcript_10920:82-1515(-)
MIARGQHHHKLGRSSSSFKERRQRAPGPPATQDEAALRIQALWRGRQARIDLNRQRGRRRELGYYTHTLGLTYISAVENRRTPVSARRAVYLLLEDPSSSQAAQFISLTILSTIVISIVAFVLETEPKLYHASPEAWLVLEVIITLIFTIVYCCRFLVCGEAEPPCSPIRFVLAPMNLCDLIAVLPFYVEVFLRSVGVYDTAALRAFRVVRLIRVVRIFKLGSYASGMHLMVEALRNSSQAIAVLIFLLFMGVIIFSSALYNLEILSCPVREEMSTADIAEYMDDCADGFNRLVSPKFGLCCNEDSAPRNFPSIIAACWWSVVTMTSVGYGEVYPKTAQGKLVGFAAMLVGMVLIALPVAIVGQKFQDIYESHDLEEAKIRASARMKVSGQVWSLVPDSDIISRLRGLRVKDPMLASSVADLTKYLEEAWEHREQLSRERRCQLEQQKDIHQKVEHLLSGMNDAAFVSPNSSVVRPG